MRETQGDRQAGWQRGWGKAECSLTPYVRQSLEVFFPLQTSAPLPLSDLLPLYIHCNSPESILAPLVPSVYDTSGSVNIASVMMSAFGCW